jgi:hypothetical protein
MQINQSKKLVISSNLRVDIGKGSGIMYNLIVVCFMQYVVCCRSRKNGVAVWH